MSDSTYTPPDVIWPKSHCPICDFDYDGWSLISQLAHVTMEHSWRERLRLRRRTRLPLRELLIQRKYGDAS